MVTWNIYHDNACLDSTEPSEGQSGAGRVLMRGTYVAPYTDGQAAAQWSDAMTEFKAAKELVAGMSQQDIRTVTSDPMLHWVSQQAQVSDAMQSPFGQMGQQVGINNALGPNVAQTRYVTDEIPVTAEMVTAGVKVGIGSKTTEQNLNELYRAMAAVAPPGHMRWARFYD